MNNQLEIFNFQDNDVVVIKTDDDIWFRGSTVGQILGYVNPRDAIRKHVDIQDTVKYSDIPIKIELKRKYKLKSHYLFINKRGLTQFIIKSRLPEATEVAKAFGIDVMNHKYECKESESIGAIRKVFEGEDMEPQFSVGKYRVDLYFSHFNICVECDENGHTDRSEIEERKRHRYITKKLKCQWVRFNPDDKKFNIYAVINKLYTMIKRGPLSIEELENEQNEKACEQLFDFLKQLHYERERKEMLERQRLQKKGYILEIMNLVLAKHTLHMSTLDDRILEAMIEYQNFLKNIQN